MLNSCCFERCVTVINWPWEKRNLISLKENEVLIWSLEFIILSVLISESKAYRSSRLDVSLWNIPPHCIAIDRFLVLYIWLVFWKAVGCSLSLLFSECNLLKLWKVIHHSEHDSQINFCQSFSFTDAHIDSWSVCLLVRSCGGDTRECCVQINCCNFSLWTREKKRAILI